MLKMKQLPEFGAASDGILGHLRFFTLGITISYKKSDFFARNAPCNRLISNSFCPTEIIIIMVNKFVHCATNLTRKNCLNVNS